MYLDLLNSKTDKLSRSGALLEPIELVGRQNELNTIAAIAKNDGDLLITGTPGSGRLMLVKQAAQEVNARLLRIDCLRASNGQDFIHLLINELYQVFDKKYWDFIKKILLDLDLECIFFVSNLSNKSQLNISDNLSDLYQEKAFKIVVVSIQKLLEKIGGRVIIVLERFYHIRSWDRQRKWEKTLRTQISLDSKVSYIILGTIADATTENSSMQDEDIEIVELRPLSKEIVTAWARQALRNHNLTFNVDDGALDLFLDTVRGHIREARILIKYIVLCCGQNQEVNKDDIYKSILNLIDDFSVTFESLLLMLPHSQLQLLKCLAVEPNPQPHSKDYLKKYGLARGGTLQAALKGLQQKGLIYDSKENYQLTLPLLAYWLRENRV